MKTSRIPLLVSAALLAACGGGESDSATPAYPNVAFCQEHLPAVEAYLAESRAAHPVPDDPRYGGTAVMGAFAELTGGLNPTAAAFYESVLHHQFVGLMTLIDYDEGLVPRPYLAESFEIADDNTSVTFHLRRDVFWHDGEPTDAHDVAFTYRVVTDPASGFPNSAFWDLYVKDEGGVEVLDDYTVRIHLQPHPDFLDPWRQVAIMPEHLLGDVPRAEIAQHPWGSQCPIGNGPFVFWSHVEGDRWEFRANAAFPEGLGGRPFLDGYVVRIVPDPSTLLTELLTGGIHVYMQPTAEQARRIIDDPDTELVRYPSRTFVFVAWNSRRPQLADPRVRRALTMAIDRQAAVEAVLQGYARVANGTVPPFHWAFDPEGPSVAYDPAGASALLAEAGWVDRDGDGVRENAAGVPLEISLKTNAGNAPRADLAVIMQAQLGEVGVAARPEIVEGSTLMSQINDAERRDFDGVILGLTVEFKLSDRDLLHSDRLDAPYAWPGTENPEIDRLIDAITVEVDRERATELWREYQRVLHEEHPFTFLYFPDRLTGVSADLRGVRMDARGELLSIREWYFDPESR